MMKRRFDSFPDDGKKQRQEVPENELKFLIHSKAAGAIIGKGGENIKRMREQFEGINISIPDSASPERVLVLQGAQEDQVLDIVRDILVRLDEVLKDKGGSGSEVRLIVHASLAGAVIGKGGSRIKELREASTADIKVYTDRCPMSNERVIRVNGENNDCVLDCLGKILVVLSDQPIKGTSQPYDSANYDPSFYDQYGGFQPEKGYRPPPGAGRMQGGFSGGGGGRMPSGFSSGFGGGGPIGAMGRGGFGGGMAGGMGMGATGTMGIGATGGMGMGASRGVNALGLNVSAGGPVQTTQVTIPNDLAGTIIGKGGERIGRIRTESCAGIAIDTDTTGQDERIITITGNQNQIQLAQYLLQQAVRSSPAGRKYIQEQLGSGAARAQ